MPRFQSLSRTSPGQGGSRGSNMSGQTSHVTYAEGTVLRLVAHEISNESLDVRIIRLYRPFSHACVMYVEILNDTSALDNIPERAVLKLFDRRLATTLRGERNVGAWSTALEDNFVESVNDGSADSFVQTLQQSEYPSEPHEDWTDVECEAYMHFWCTDMFATELKTYRHLQSLQGNEIPRLFSSVTLSIQPHEGDDTPDGNNVSRLLQVQGILMEHIVGSTLARMPDFIPSQHWQKIFNEVLKIVQLYSDREVINERIRAENIVASPRNAADGDFRVVMLDFAHSDIRKEDQSDVEWGRWKAEENEEGTIANLMSTILMRVGFTLQYVPSHRYQEFMTNE